jgi:hypothetical protein
MTTILNKIGRASGALFFLFACVTASALADSFGPPSCGSATWWNTTTLTFVSRWKTGGQGGTADSAHVRAHDRWSAGDTVWAVIYADDSESPSDLLARSDSILLTTATCSDYTVRFDGEQLGADTWYWIGVYIKTDGGSGFSPCLHSDPDNDTMYYSSGDVNPPDPFSGTRDVNTNGPCVIVFYSAEAEPEAPALRRRKAEMLLGQSDNPDNSNSSFIPLMPEGKYR